jgi:hypothetical protein
MRSGAAVTDVWERFPQLATEPQPDGTGRASLIQILRLEDGPFGSDQVQTIHPVLAVLTQLVNENCCTHGDGDLLCRDCSSNLYSYEPALIDTPAPEDLEEARALAVHLALRTRSFVQPLLPTTTEPDWRLAYDAAQAWLDADSGHKVDTAEQAFLIAQETATYSSMVVRARMSVVEHVRNAAGATAFTASTYAYALSDQRHDHYARIAVSHAAHAHHAVYGATPHRLLQSLLEAYYEFMKRPIPVLDEHCVARVRVAVICAGLPIQ